MADAQRSGGWLHLGPSYLKGIAAVLTALGVLLVAMHQVGVFSPEEAPGQVSGRQATSHPGNGHLPEGRDLEELPVQPGPAAGQTLPFSESGTRARIVLRNGSNKMMVRVGTCDGKVMRSVQHGQMVMLVERSGDNFIFRDDDGVGCIPQQNVSTIQN